MPSLNFRLYKVKIRVLFFQYLLGFVERPAFAFLTVVFLVFTFGWRLLWSFGLFLYNRRNPYSDLYLFNLVGFLRDLFSIVRWSRLGDFFEALRVLGPSRVIRFVTRPASKLAQLESTWYWKSNPAMWLPDKMWNDIVDSFDRKYLSRTKSIIKKVKREVENFADYPYSRMATYFWYVVVKISKFKLPRIRWPRFFGQFFMDIRLRLSAVFASRSMLVYHGLGKNAVVYGKVPGFLASPLTFDFDKKRVVFKDPLLNSGPINTDKVVEEEIIAKLSTYTPNPSFFSKPTVPVSRLTIQQKRYKQLIQYIRK